MRTDEGRGGFEESFGRKYLQLLQDALIEAPDLGLEESGELHTLRFQCRCQKPIFNGEWLWVDEDAFDLEGGHMSVVGISSAKCPSYSRINCQVYFTL